MMHKPLLTALLLLPFAAAAQNTYTPELLLKLGRLGEMQVSPDQKTVAYTVTRYSLTDNKGQSDIWTVPTGGGAARQLTNTPTVSENTLNWRADGKLTFMSAEGGSDQLYVLNADGSGKQLLSGFGTEEGVANLKYAPKGNFILYTQDVKTGKSVQDWYPDLPKADAKIIDDLNYRHWSSWDDFKVSHVYFQPVGTDGKPVGSGKDIMTGEKFDAPLQPFGGNEQLAFSPDGYSLAYTSRKLTGKAEAESTNSDIYLYDIRTGQTRNLSEGLGGYDTEPVFSPDGSQVAWLSMATPGFESDRNGIVVYDFKTKKRQDVTAGSEQAAGNVRWSPDGKTIYFASALAGTQQLFSVSAKGGKVKQLTKGTFNYNSFELAGKDAVIVNKTTQATPADLVRVDLKSGRETPLTTINQQELAGVKTGRLESRMVATTDGKQMQVYVTFPPDFDPSKKYPTLLYCQGGPQSPISQSFSYRWNFQLMAAQGYIVVAPNRRGLPGFGTEWNNSISGDWGGQPIRDYLSAIDAVSQEAYVDKDRRGCVGASYGGYSVYQLAGKHEGRFKTFIAHAGLYNLTSWYPSTEEMFFAKHDIGGAPWETPLHKSYTEFNPQQFAQNWDTPILVIHGAKDFRVPEGQGMEAFGTAQLRGIPSRFLYFPNEGHWIQKPQNAVLWNRVFFEWLGRTLKPEGSAGK
ncbi:S9 family peptidase [Hymenobacter psychrophilus]|uniref:Dipeptidyl aminopeptidase/acylaminoacyl peptidase n=1 Tax=Hymenobacter psychrophilus TaxID=651662 RepID=A0A1H3KMK7_9BACT|nr:S9 family peptidase [Hymenobacter psychrophilus]SDY53269.1 Dipeptidyl aminopeptidase/acylaminoacyl peptidase [Hymenobacter psychrophilus]